MGNFVSIDHIKRHADHLAHEMKKSHSEALDEAAQEAGFSSYKEAVRVAHRANIDRGAQINRGELKELLTASSVSVKVRYGTRDYGEGSPELSGLNRLLNTPPAERVREGCGSKLTDTIYGILLGFYRMAESRGGHIDIITLRYAEEEIRELLHSAANMGGASSGTMSKKGGAQ